MKKYRTLIILGIVFVVAAFVIYRYNLFEYISLKNIPALREQILSLGGFAFFAYFMLYVLGCLFFLPGLPLTILGGALFGPVLGTIYTVISASVGLALAFLVARYALRGVMLEKFGDSDAFKKIDEGVNQEAWRILMITRLVPIFPFNIQNYIYGLTKVNFLLYWGLSTLFIIPGTSAYTLSVGAVLSGEFSSKNIIYLGVGVLCFVLVSFIPRFIPQKTKPSTEPNTK